MSPSAQRWFRRVGAPSTQRPGNSGQVDIRAHPPIEPARDQGPHHQDSVEWFTCSRAGGRRSGTTRRPDALGLEHAAIAQQRIEDAGEATGEGDHGRLFPAARRDAQGPGPQLLRLGRTAAEDRDGGLNQEPAGARVAGLGDGAAALRLARAALAGHEAEVGFELMGVVEAPDVVDGGEEGGGGDGADAGDGAQARHTRILNGEVLDPLVAVRELLVEGPHEGEERRDHREQAARQGQVPDALDKMLRAAGGDAVAVLAEQGSDDRDVARARSDEGVADHQAAAHMPLGIGEPMRGAVGPEQARLRCAYGSSGAAGCGAGGVMAWERGRGEGARGRGGR